jgi:hypothetical protein
MKLPVQTNHRKLNPTHPEVSVRSFQYEIPDPKKGRQYSSTLSINFEREESPKGIILHADITICPATDEKEKFEKELTELDLLEGASQMLHHRRGYTLALIQPGTKPHMRLETEYWDPPQHRINPETGKQSPGYATLLPPDWWRGFHPSIIPELEAHQFNIQSPDAVSLLAILCLRDLAHHIPQEKQKQLCAYPEHLATFLTYGVIQNPNYKSDALQIEHHKHIDIPTNAWKVEKSEAMCYLDCLEANLDKQTPKNTKDAERLFVELTKPLSKQGKYLAKQWTRLLRLGRAHQAVVNKIPIPAEMIRQVCKGGWKDHECIDPLTIIRSGVEITTEIRKTLAKHVGSRSLSIYSNMGSKEEANAWNTLAEIIIGDPEKADPETIQDCTNIAYALYVPNNMGVPVPPVWKKLTPFILEITAKAIIHSRENAGGTAKFYGTSKGLSRLLTETDSIIVGKAVEETKKALAELETTGVPDWLADADRTLKSFSPASQGINKKTLEDFLQLLFQNIAKAI